jgi:hypothetical protein
MSTEERQQAPEMNELMDLLLLIELGEKDRCSGQGHSVQEARALLAKNGLQYKTLIQHASSCHFGQTQCELL